MDKLNAVTNSPSIDATNIIGKHLDVMTANEIEPVGSNENLMVLKNNAQVSRDGREALQSKDGQTQHTQQQKFSLGGAFEDVATALVPTTSTTGFELVPLVAGDSGPQPVTTETTIMTPIRGGHGPAIIDNQNDINYSEGAYPLQTEVELAQLNQYGLSFKGFDDIKKASDLGGGVIAVMLKDGFKFSISEATSPHIFSSWLEVATVMDNPSKMKIITDNNSLGFKMADHTTVAPMLDYLTSDPSKAYSTFDISAMDKNIIRYKTKDGAGIQVVKEFNPELYAQVEQTLKTREKITSPVLTAYAPIPKFSDLDTKDIPVDQGEGVMLFTKKDGSIFNVLRENNPALCDFLTKASAVLSDRNSMETLDAYSGSVLEEDDAAQAPKLPDILKLSTAYGLNGGDGSNFFDYQTADGKKHLVSRDLTPTLFAAVKDQYDARATITQYIGKDYRPATDHDTLSILSGSTSGPLGMPVPVFKSLVGTPTELGHGLIAYEMPKFGSDKTEHIIASRDNNPGLYLSLQKKISESQASEIDAVRTKHKLPSSADTDVLQLKSDPGDPASQSIGAKATQDLITDYKQKIAAGMSPDDNRAKLVDALEAQHALQNGWGGMTPAETGLDQSKVNSAVLTLFNDPQIKADFEAHIQTASAPRRALLSVQISSTLTSSAYTDAMIEMENNGKGAQARAMVARDVNSLALVNPELASSTGELLVSNSLNRDFEKSINNTNTSRSATTLPPESQRDLTLDTGNIVLKSLRSGSALVRHGTQTYDFFSRFLLDKKNVDDLGKLLTKALPWADGASFDEKVGNMAGWTEAQLTTVMNQAHIDPAGQTGLIGLMGKAQAAGVWGTLGGIFAVASFSKKIADGKTTTPADQLSIGRDVVSLLAVSGHLGKTVTSAIDYGFGTTTRLNLGLDNSLLPELYGKTGFLGKSPHMVTEVAATVTITVPGKAAIPAVEYRPEQLAVSAIPAKPAQKGIAGAPDIPAHPAVAAVPYRAEQQAVAAIPAIPDTTFDLTKATRNGVDLWEGTLEGQRISFTKQNVANLINAQQIQSSGSLWRFAGAGLKVIGTVADLAGGAIDIYSGINAYQGAYTNSGKAAGALQAGSGIAQVAAGAVGTAALLGITLPPAVTTIPFFMVGALLGAASFATYGASLPGENDAAKKAGRARSGMSGAGNTTGP